jgi:hypothetical protein
MANMMAKHGEKRFLSAIQEAHLMQEIQFQSRKQMIATLTFPTLATSGPIGLLACIPTNGKPQVTVQINDEKEKLSQLNDKPDLFYGSNILNHKIVNDGMMCSFPIKKGVDGKLFAHGKRIKTTSISSTIRDENIPSIYATSERHSETQPIVKPADLPQSNLDSSKILLEYIQANLDSLETTAEVPIAESKLCVYESSESIGGSDIHSSNQSSVNASSKSIGCSDIDSSNEISVNESSESIISLDIHSSSIKSAPQWKKFEENLELAQTHRGKADSNYTLGNIALYQ